MAKTWCAKRADTAPNAAELGGSGSQCISGGKSTPVLRVLYQHMISQVWCFENLGCICSFNGVLWVSWLTYVETPLFFFFKKKDVV